MVSAKFLRIVGFVLAMVISFAIGGADNSLAQSAPSTASASSPSEAILLTIFLRHDQSKTLDEINQHLKQTGWYQKFPPPGVEIVSWYVMMGIGQVVTLRVPPDKLREVNRVIEESAWGGYHTEFYPTYDYKPVWEAMPGHHQ
ncbi:MAG TPA: hypothetical protein VM782_11805 [Stellaceae bacterium]|nr:hypothetical protein [Stellaceae bacterium]